MLKRSLLVLAAIAATTVYTAYTQTTDDTKIIDGQEYRVIQTNGKEITGTVTTTATAYKVKVSSGILVTIPKNRVHKLIPVAAEAEGGADNSGSTEFRRQITADEIAQIVGNDELDLGPSDVDEQVDLHAPLPIDEASVNDMERIAGSSAKRLPTDHFILVYTSSKELAQNLASRLESVYDWNVRFMEMLDIPRTSLPDSRLEIFFFGTYEEYEAYQTLNGFNMMGAIGFYMPTNNRSAFFDMTTYPPYANVLKRAEDPGLPWQERVKYRNYVKRRVEHENLEVVQHEASHHIHFNIGIFPRAGDVPTWAVEGLATMFEVPPSSTGASLGSINHYRLYHFRRYWGEHGERLPPLRQFILNDGMWGGFESYLIGWALNQYLYRTHREGYAKWMQLLAKRPDDWRERVEVSEKQEQFENIFGEVNDEWIKNFNDYIAGIELKTSELPPDQP